MIDLLDFDNLFEEGDLPVPLSSLSPTPVSSSRPISPSAESIAESPQPELSFAEYVAESPESCSTEPSAASPVKPISLLINRFNLA
ncbi:hypothetical protein NPIL_397911 [Nephila pilipes]|uniref:Uncharacterized protein n=1 Tax=Nephila pilipes TaxID=299642 RepID=A0A8X6N6I4_NEPPI|nr:hypothetical protein NPIL_397911 [Nephila pilipes]